jgi:hypothetical protein
MWNSTLVFGWAGFRSWCVGPLLRVDRILIATPTLGAFGYCSIAAATPTAILDRFYHSCRDSGKTDFVVFSLAVSNHISGHNQPTR